MQKEKEPPTYPTYEDLKKLNSDDLLDVDINSIPKHLHSYVVGRLDECIQADTGWLSIYEKVKAKYDDQYRQTEKQKKLKEQAKADLYYEQLDKARIAKMKILEKSNVNNARYKSVEQAKADRQFAKLYKPERMKRASEERTTIKVADVFTKVNLLIMERYEIGFYNNFRLRGKQVEKWIALFKNNYSIPESAKALGIKEDSLRRNMQRLTDAMNELFLETFDSEYGRNEITKSDLFNYIQKELEKTDR
jgi:hypothetical protein